eukprot:g6262.t1
MATAKYFANTFGSYFDDPSFTDVTFTFENDQKLCCHRIILAAQSSKFESLLRATTAGENIPVGKSHTFRGFSSIIRYLYTRELPSSLTEESPTADTDFALECISSALAFEVSAVSDHCYSTIERWTKEGLGDPVKVLSYAERNQRPDKRLRECAIKRLLELDEDSLRLAISAQKKDSETFLLTLACASDLLRRYAKRNEEAPLVQAVKFSRHRPGIVENLLEAGENVDTPGRCGRTPLKVALEDDAPESVVEILVHAVDHDVIAATHGSQPYNLDSKTRDGRRSESLLHAAALSGRIGHCELLIRRGADVNAVDESGRSPLHIAVASGADTVVELLIEHGAVPNLQDITGQTALHIAAATTNESAASIVQCLLSKKANPNMPDKQGRTALHLACASGRVNVMAVMLRRCYRSTLCATDYERETPLHATMRAPASQAPIIADLLLSMFKAGGVEEVDDMTTDSNSNMLAKDDKRERHSATDGDAGGGYDRDKNVHEKEKNRLLPSPRTRSVLELLKMSNQIGDTALHMAARRRDEGCHNLIPVLLEHGANPNIKNSQGFAVLHLIASWRAPNAEASKRSRLVDMLASYGADFNARSTGTTPAAVRNLFSSLRRSMTAKGSSEIGSESADRGKAMYCTPLHFAVAVRDFVMARALVRNGGSLSMIANGLDVLQMVLSQHLADSDVMNRGGMSEVQVQGTNAGRSSNTLAVAKQLILAVKHAPPWIHNDEAPVCMSCKNTWSLRNRRHHCRHCGRVVCGKCSDQTLDLSLSKPNVDFGTRGAVRVCNLCYRTLSFAPAIQNTSMSDQSNSLSSDFPSASVRSGLYTTNRRKYATMTVRTKKKGRRRRTNGLGTP